MFRVFQDEVIWRRTVKTPRPREQLVSPPPLPTSTGLQELSYFSFVWMEDSEIYTYSKQKLENAFEVRAPSCSAEVHVHPWHTQSRRRRALPSLANAVPSRSDSRPLRAHVHRLLLQRRRKAVNSMPFTPTSFGNPPFTQVPSSSTSLRTSFPSASHENSPQSSPESLTSLDLPLIRLDVSPLVSATQMQLGNAA